MLKVAFISFAAASGAFLILTLLLATTWRGRLSGLLMIAACVTSAVWAGVSAILAGYGHMPAGVMQMTELVRNGAWFMFLIHILVPGDMNEETARRRRLFTTAFGAVLILGAFLTTILPIVMRHTALGGDFPDYQIYLGWVLLAVSGLFLVEQVFRNRRPEERWGIKHLCLGLGGVFAYDLFLYSDALLLHRLDAQLWAARGVVNALIVPLLAVSAARNPSWSLEVHVSRKVVFHSATLFGAGIYLMVMAGAGYYIKHYGGTWGSVLQVAFFFGSGVFLFVLLFSGQIRTRLRLLLSEHFFSFKYDYREEWLRFTETLANGRANISEAVIRGLSEIVGSQGGALWVKREGQFFQLDTCVGIVEPELSVLLADDTLVLFLERTGSLVDLSDYSMHPESYEGFEVPGWMDDWGRAWIIIPLLFHGKLNAFVVLARPEVKRPVNWEDRDLLVTAGKQAASHIAQNEANKALMQARQFEAFSKISAYVAHDLKNLLAQQTLVVANAEKHKGNPAFIEDVVRTLRSSVDRMNRLMEQLRNGVRGEQRDLVLLDEVLGEVMEIRSKQKPQPVFEKIDEGLTVMAQKDRLATVFGHLIQNAQEATEADGIVTVRLFRNGGRAVVEIEDKGSGMSQDFIRDRLFRPFDSTKGLTGMGIGAFESREFVRALGGDLLVKSVLGEGSSFRILLPCAGAVNEGVPSIPAGQEAVK